MIADAKLAEAQRLAAIGFEAQRRMERGLTWRSALTCGCIFEDELDPDRCTRPCRLHAEMAHDLATARARIAELEAENFRLMADREQDLIR